MRSHVTKTCSCGEAHCRHYVSEQRLVRYSYPGMSAILRVPRSKFPGTRCSVPKSPIISNKANTPTKKRGWRTTTPGRRRASTRHIPVFFRRLVVSSHVVGARRACSKLSVCMIIQWHIIGWDGSNGPAGACVRQGPPPPNRTPGAANCASMPIIRTVAVVSQENIAWAEAGTKTTRSRVDQSFAGRI